MPVYKVPAVLSYPKGGGPGVNVWHIRTLDNVNQEASVKTLTDLLHTFYTSIASGQTVSSAWLQQGCTVDIPEAINVETSEAVPVDFAAITAGGNAAVAPPATALCITWRTSLRARRGRGRTFLGPLSQSVLDSNGTPTEAARNVLSDACAALVESSDSAANGAIVVYGRQSIGSEARVARDITGYRVPNEFAVMRSRRD